MEVFAFYALVGLLLLVPLEIVFLIIASALARRRKFEPRLTKAISQKKEEKYGWEGLLKLPPEGKPSRSHNYVMAAAIILLLAVIVAVPGLFLVAPSLQLNLSKQPVNETAPVPHLNETAGKGLFSNLSFPRFNISAPEVNASKIFAPLKANKKSVASGLAAVLAAFVIFFFIRRRRKLAVVDRAGKAYEKPVKKAAAKRKGEEPKAVGMLFSGLWKARKFRSAGAILLLLVTITAIVYFLRGIIHPGVAAWLLEMAVKAKGFALLYRWYILAGLLALIIVLAVLRKAEK